MRDHRIQSTIVGASRPEQLRESVGLATQEIPDALFDELETLTPDRSHWIGPQNR